MTRRRPYRRPAGLAASPRTAPTRALILAALRTHGPATALELQDRTGLMAANFRRFLAPPDVVRTGFVGVGLGRSILFALSASGLAWVKANVLPGDFCDCGRPVDFWLPVVQLSADGARKAWDLGLCAGCLWLLPARERGKARARARGPP